MQCGLNELLEQVLPFTMLPWSRPKSKDSKQGSLYSALKYPTKAAFTYVL